MNPLVTVDRKLIASQRRQKRISQAQLASYLGISTKTYQRVETDLGYDPGVEMLGQVADAIGLRFSQIVIEDPPTEPISL